ncbi:MAG: TAXI family TRAP transporter solute-binding subunit, partial [Caldilinea sp.]
ALYGGVIHLVVTEASGIKTVADLEGKRIAPGNAGSGAALSAERYLRHLGLWDKMSIEYLGYSQAASAMGDGQLDGFWILAAFPNASVTEATTVTKIRLLDTATPGDESGFFEAYPFYAKRNLLGGFYDNVPDDVPSFQDTAIWVAHKDVPDDLVYNAIKAVFSEEGLKRMREAHPAAAEMTIEGGLIGIPVALHPGAYRFWQEQGVEIADYQKPTE